MVLKYSKNKPHKTHILAKRQISSWHSFLCR